MTDQISCVDPITISGVKWTCYVVDNGNRYEWRSPGGRGLAARNEGKGSFWAKTDGRSVGTAFPTLKLAMGAAVAAGRMRRAA